MPVPAVLDGQALVECGCTLNKQANLECARRMIKWLRGAETVVCFA